MRQSASCSRGERCTSPGSSPTAPSAATARSCPCCCARRTTRCQRLHERRRSGSSRSRPTRTLRRVRTRSARSPTRPQRASKSERDRQAQGRRRPARRPSPSQSCRRRDREATTALTRRTKRFIATELTPSDNRRTCFAHFPEVRRTNLPLWGDLAAGQEIGTARRYRRNGDIRRDWIPLPESGALSSGMDVDADALIERSRQLAATPLGDRDRLALAPPRRLLPGSRLRARNPCPLLPPDRVRDAARLRDVLRALLADRLRDRHRVGVSRRSSCSCRCSPCFRCSTCRCALQQVCSSAACPNTHAGGAGRPQPSAAREFLARASALLSY